MFIIIVLQLLHMYVYMYMYICELVLKRILLFGTAGQLMHGSPNFHTKILTYSNCYIIFSTEATGM